MTPSQDAAVVERARGSPVEVELVWAAPSQPMPVRFFVQVVAVESGGWREVHADYVDESATLVRLEPVPARYAWRVHAVATEGQRYAVGGWSQFTVESPVWSASATG